MSNYELAYLATETDVRSKLYEDRNAFLKDFQILETSGKPMMAQGPGKDSGAIIVERRNGWNDDDVILTAEVNFGYGKVYKYSAGKHYSGLYEVIGRSGNCIVSVSYKWRQIDDFRAELFEKGYDEPTAFESILVKKVK